MKKIKLLLLAFISTSLYAQQAKNVILLIGDGMGITHIQVNKMLNNNVSIFDQFPYTGLSRTASADNDVTDSGAGGTALASGSKTNNHKVGVDVNDKPLKSILEIAKKSKKSTGLIVTSSVTHATPADFIAHVPSRDSEEEIATFYLKQTIDFFMGAGQKFFDNRSDKKNLYADLVKQHFTLINNKTNPDTSLRADKLGWFIPDSGCEDSIRPSYLPKGTAWAIKNLSTDLDGFFMMVEGSEIDWACHENNLSCMHRQMNEFEEAIRVALEFAKQDKNTLVVVTADHETGGLAIQGSYKNLVKSSFVFTTKDHTGTPVGVFAYGPGAENFTGFFENTDVFQKIKKAFGL